ncbi:MAG: hypothetical protein ACMUJM_21520 [bacterium]
MISISFNGPICALFDQLADDNLQLCIAEKIWHHIKELIMRSSKEISYKFGPDIFLHFLDLIEEAFRDQIIFSCVEL